ncbi:MAG: hypothetical protein HC902_05900 [Calothrix sp. SM1_5_4]|nr:hypothetical protein [Calothrix sp. SM1_5_4]
MKSRHLFAHALSALALILTLTFNQCSEVGFVQQNGFVEGYSTLPDGTKVFQVSQDLGGRQIKPLDIVWIVDNSGSMSAEAAHVRSNLTQFVNQLSSLSDVKIAVVSRVGSTGTSVGIPQIPIPSLQVNQTVESTDALRILQSAICPATAPAGSACSDLREFPRFAAP